MRNLFWRTVAAVVSSTPVRSWIMAKAQRTPYTHITGPDGTVYMWRWWLFNPYEFGNHGADKKWGTWLPSVRVHRIMRPDSDRHMHDHPWNARTVILCGWYCEERIGTHYYPMGPTVTHWHPEAHSLVKGPDGTWRNVFLRERGYTGTLKFGQYHRISDVSDGGVWTLFITWRKQGTWGFLVDGKKVPWRDYLGEGA